ncbi:MAG: hypothetical protein KAH30_03380, partial [Caldisericia bacterium]|nr:hypothetical protein [Caldisericia bacterium]
DKYIVTHWHETPVQIDGIRFDTPLDHKWISVKLEPSYRNEQTFGRGVIKNGGVLKIYAYDTSVTKSYQLASRVCQMFDETFVDGAFIDIGVPDGRGSIPLHDGIYETLLLFQVDLFEIKCKQTPAPNPFRWIDETGATWTDEGSQTWTTK